MPDRSVDDEDIQPAIVVEVEPGGTEARVRQARKPDSCTRGLFFEDTGSVVHVEIVALTGDLRDEQVFVAVLVEIAGVDAHAAFGLTVSAKRRASEQRSIRERAAVPVHPQLIRRAIIGDVNVDPAVAIEVRGHDAERRPKLMTHARSLGHISKRPVAIVVKEVVRLRGVDTGWTVVEHAADRVEAGFVPLYAVVHV